MPKTLEKPEVTAGFYFRESDHMYFMDGKPMTGVTTILAVIAKPALIQWAANMACDYIHEKVVKPIGRGEEQYPIFRKLPEILEEARTAHRKKKEAAGEAGTDVHSLIEKWIKRCIVVDFLTPLHQDELENPQVVKFHQWATEKGVKFLESEKKLYSPAHWIAGTTDFTCEIDGKRYVGDLKTSSGIYYEMFMQCAAYRMMLEEMGEEKYHGSVIVRCGKDGSFETKERYDYETDLKGFMGALALYRAQETYNI